MLSPRSPQPDDSRQSRTDRPLLVSVGDTRVESPEAQICRHSVLPGKIQVVFVDELLAHESATLTRTINLFRSGIQRLEYTNLLGLIDCIHRWYTNYASGIP